MSGETVLRALGREHALAILRGTAEPTRAADLAERLEIPTASCHRRLEELVDIGLIRAVGRGSERGPSAQQYQRVVDDLHVSIEGRMVEVIYEPDANTLTKLDLAWQGLRV